MFMQHTTLDPLLQMSLQSLQTQEAACPYFLDLCMRASNYFERNDSVNAPLNYFMLVSQDVPLPFREAGLSSNRDGMPSKPWSSFADEIHHLSMEDRRALAHEILTGRISLLIDDKDRQYIAYMLNAITHGALPMLLQIVCALSVAYPEKISAYAATVTDCLMSAGAGICLTYLPAQDLILLHGYHEDFAIAIRPGTLSSRIVSISTEWDGTVTTCDGIQSRCEEEELMTSLQEQCIRRTLLQQNERFLDVPRWTEDALAISEEAAA